MPELPPRGLIERMIEPIALVADRKAWLMAILDLNPADDTAAYKWERVAA